MTILKIKGTIKPPKLSKTVDLSTLFRVKGKSGLYYPKSKPDKRGMVRMIRYGGSEAYTVQKMNCQGPLSGVIIYTFGGGHVTLAKTLDRLQRIYKDDIVDVDKFMIKLKDTPEMLNDICPKCDTNQFKPFHAERVLRWYNEILQRSKIENFQTSNRES